MPLNDLIGYKIKKETYDIFGGRDTIQIPNQSNQGDQSIKCNPTDVTTQHGQDPQLDSKMRNDSANQIVNLPFENTIPLQPVSPSTSIASESGNSTPFEYHYDFDDLNTIGMINTPQFSALSDCDIEDNITPPPYIDFTMNNIGPIGAITTPQFTAMKKESTFINNRSLQISEDLNYLLDDSGEDIDDNDGSGTELITDLLEFYGIRDNEIYKYFDEILQIYYLNELTNMDPHVIIKPLVGFNVKQLIELNKFVQLISHKIGENPSINSGTFNNKWITLNKNKFHKIFQSKSPGLINFNESKAIMNDNEIIKLVSSSKHNEILEYKMVQSITLGVIELPDFSPHDRSLFSFGITINEHNVCINDRLSIFHNNTFISNIGNGQFIENDDDITIKIFIFGKTCILHFSSVFTDNIQIEMNKPFIFGDIFIKQNNGTGLYTINVC